DEQRARQAEARVALAGPEQETGHEEERGEGSGQPEVQFLAGVEAPLGCAPAEQPAPVVAVEEIELAQRAAERSPVGERDDDEKGSRPSDPGVEVDVLDQRATAHPLGETRQVKDETRAEQDEERSRVKPVRSEERREGK